MATVNGVYHPVDNNPYALTGEDAGEGDLGRLAATAWQAALDAAQQAAASVYYDILTSALLPRADGESVPLFTWADRDGYVGMSLGSDAALTVGGGVIVPDETLDLASLNSPVQLVSTTHTDASLTWGVADSDGRLSVAVDAAGRFTPHRGAGAPTAMRTQVACIGDSLTRGTSGGTTWPIEDSWPYLMGQAHPGVTVHNLGLPGWATDEIRIRWGILPLYLSVDGGTIPTSGSVGATTGQSLGLRPAITYTGELAGIPGAVTYDGPGWTFTRANAGLATPVPGKARFVPDMEDDYSSHTIVLWVGRNDVSQGFTGRYSTVTEHVVSGVLETVEWLAPRSKAVVVVGTTQMVQEDNTHPRYQTVVDINERLSELLPTKYLDMRTYLNHQAIYDAGLTPTQADLDAMDADGPPPQIWDGGSHFLPVVAPYVAEQIGTALEQRGLI